MTGKQYEIKVEHALKSRLGGNRVRAQVKTPVGKRWGGGRIVDILIDEKIVVSLKHQENPGSVDEKNIAEVLNLEHAVLDCGYDKAILVLNDPYRVMKTRAYLLENENLKALGVYNVEVLSHDSFCEQYSLSVSQL